MPLENTHLETLKFILENSLHPEKLDSHPWSKSLSVLDALANNPDLQDSPGQALISVIGKVFAEMMPSVPPRHGKRLDTRWGEFGILAAQYFAPIAFGASSPDSLRDAWGRIDQSILLFVYGKSDDSHTDAEKLTYKLVENELDVAPNSTLSDWHRKGLQHLLDLVLAHENYLAKSMSQPPIISLDEQPIIRADEPVLLSNKKTRRKFVIPLLILILLGLILIGGLKVWKIYNIALVVWQDAVRVQELVKQPGLDLELVKSAGPAFSNLRQDFQLLKKEAEPYLWLTPWLNWVPVYGGDIASAKELIILTDSLLASADISIQAALPLADAINGEGQAHLTPPRLAELLSKAQPKFADARLKLDSAVAARNRLNIDDLSPRLHDLVTNDIDPLLPLMQEALGVAIEFPRLMGATDEGPKTYLLLVQNEDELRPTGGFITAAGTLLIRDGRISNMVFENSGNLDNWTKPYPTAPWQLSEYMNSPVLIFRDANWFTNYPTTVTYAEYLYSYVSDHSVDGVIAFDQQMLVDVLEVIGPVKLEDVPYPINSKNVLSYMRAAKTPTAAERASPDWGKKQFLNKISYALILKLFSGDIPWQKLSMLLVRVLNERHLLIQLDSPIMTNFLAQYDWDGAVRLGNGDFLMVVDSNVGFNKTNAVIETELFYDVDLTNPSALTSSLTVAHKNNSVGVVSCQPWYKATDQDDKDYPIQDCYWNYMRVYKADGTKLTESTPQLLPPNWMILNKQPPAKVDVLDEKIDGVQAFGTIQVVPGGQSLSMSFQFALPASIIKTQTGSDQMTYHLKVQKQPGTLAVPITIRIHLANNALVQNMPEGTVLEDNNILIETNLREDVEIEIVFSIP